MKFSTVAVILSSVLAFAAEPAIASHHFESAQSIQIPSINQLDNYVFPSSRADATAIVMTVSNSPKPGVDGIFNSQALYNIHIAEDDGFKKGYTYSFQFDEAGNYTVYRLDEANAEVGKKGAVVGKGELNKALTLTDNLKIWTGTAKDPFFGNSPGLHAYRKELAEGKYDPEVWKKSKGKNIFADRNCAAIVIDIPNKLLGKKIKVFMTTALENNDTWQQVQYSAIPLFSHSMLFENDALKREHDLSRPDNDQDMKNFVSARVTRASALAHSQKNPVAYGDKIADMLVPDVITYKTGTPAKFSAQEINGRKMSDDAMSEMLSILAGQPVNDAVEDHKVYSAEFPYLIPVSVK